MNRGFAPIARGWLALALLTALVAGRAPAAPETAPHVVVRPVDGGPVTGALAGLDAASLAVATSDGDRTFPLDRVLTVSVRTAREPSLAGRPHLRVTLVGGDVVHGTYAGAAGDSLTMESPDLGATTWMLESIASIVAVPADAGPCFEPEHRYAPAAEDIAYVHSGDAYSGIVLSVEDEGFEIETERGRVRRVPWDDLLVVHLQNDVPPKPEGVTLEIETVEGSRLTAAGGVRLDGDALALAPRAAPRLELAVPLDRVRVLRPAGGSFVYASDLPFESEFVPYYRDESLGQEGLQRWFATRVDRRLSGCPLRLGGTTYRHGFAVHSRSLVTLRPDQAYRRFESWFGLDDETLEQGVDGGGLVDARVVGDGKVLWEAKGVRSGEAPRRVGPLDVSEVEVLVLEVDFGSAAGSGDRPAWSDLNTLDRATWADPLLFR